MSTVSDALIEWLKTFNPTSYWQMGKIDTDKQSDSVMSYALIKEPTINTKRYISGKEVHTEYYQMSARLDSQTNSDRIENNGWFVALEHWIKEQREANNFPVIDGTMASDVSISSSYYLGQSAENTAVYSLTLAIKYTH